MQAGVERAVVNEAVTCIEQENWSAVKEVVHKKPDML